MISVNLFCANIAHFLRDEKSGIKIKYDYTASFGCFLRQHHYHLLVVGFKLDDTRDKIELKKKLSHLVQMKIRRTENT